MAIGNCTNFQFGWVCSTGNPYPFFPSVVVRVFYPYLSPVLVICMYVIMYACLFVYNSKQIATSSDNATEQ